jgi:hypothetical protein
MNPLIQDSNPQFPDLNPFVPDPEFVPVPVLRSRISLMIQLHQNDAAPVPQQWLNWI